MAEIKVETHGEQFYDITDRVKSKVQDLLQEDLSGALLIYTAHTSCALTINEAYDPAAARDMENFLKHLAPRDLSFITHKDEGPDDSPSHMKSVVLGQNLMVPVLAGQLGLGTWQGIYLAEFRDAPKSRRINLTFLPGRN